MIERQAVFMRSQASAKQNTETVWHFSRPLSPRRCEMPIKDATSSVAHQPFKAERAEVLPKLGRWWGGDVRMLGLLNSETGVFLCVFVVPCGGICNIKTEAGEQPGGCLLMLPFEIKTCLCLDYGHFSLV